MFNLIDIKKIGLIFSYNILKYIVLDICKEMLFFLSINLYILGLSEGR